MYLFVRLVAALRASCRSVTALLVRNLCQVKGIMHTMGISTFLIHVDHISIKFTKKKTAKPMIFVTPSFFSGPSLVPSWDPRKTSKKYQKNGSFLPCLFLGRGNKCQTTIIWANYYIIPKPYLFFGANLEDSLIKITNIWGDIG